MEFINFLDVCENQTRLGRKIYVPDYLSSGKHPIIDQSKKYIVAYSNDEDGLFTNVPIIVFGDVTRIIKYVDFPCFLGADGSVIIKVTNPDFVTKYVYYSLQNSYIPDTGFNRHYKFLKDIKIRKYDINKQNQIIDILDNINKAIELENNKLSLLDEYVKSHFIEIFGDVNTNPKGFKKYKIGSQFELGAGGTPKTSEPKYWENGSISWVGSNVCQNVILYENDGKYITEEGFNHSSVKLLKPDTVLVALVGATIGKTALLKFETTTNQNVLGIWNIKESGYNPYFVFYYMQFIYHKFTDLGEGNFKMASKGFVGELEIYKPPLDLQNKFSDSVILIEKVKSETRKRIQLLKELLNKKTDEFFGDNE